MPYQADRDGYQLVIERRLTRVGWSVGGFWRVIQLVPVSCATAACDVTVFVRHAEKYSDDVVRIMTVRTDMLAFWYSSSSTAVFAFCLVQGDPGGFGQG